MARDHHEMDSGLDRSRRTSARLMTSLFRAPSSYRSPRCLNLVEDLVENHELFWRKRAMPVHLVDEATLPHRQSVNVGEGEGDLFGNAFRGRWPWHRNHLLPGQPMLTEELVGLLGRTCALAIVM